MSILKPSNFFFFLFFVSLNAQEFEIIKNKYKDYEEVKLKDFTKVKMSIEDNKIKILSSQEEEYITLNPQAFRNNSLSTTYTSLTPLIESEAYIEVLEKNKYKKKKVEDFVEKKPESRSVFFDDILERKYVFPGVDIGSKKNLKSTIEYSDPFLLNKFVVYDGYPLESYKLELEIDKEIEIGFRIMNDPNNLLKFEKKESRNQTIYSWAINDVQPIKYESDSPGFLHLVPHIIIFVKNYTINNSKVEVLGSIKNLTNHYSDFVKNLNKTVCPDLKEKSIEITKGLKTEEEKIKAIYYWVNSNIKYIAFEDGYEGFIPRQAKDVFEKKYGDCKDMSSIITQMATYANLKNVYLTWIGTRDIPYGYSELAAPGVDNHMIATFEANGKHIFLDATNKETPFGLPGSFIQGKEALVKKGDKFEIINVPIVNANINLIKEKLNFEIDKDLIKGKSEISYHGLSRDRLLNELGDIQNNDRFEKIKKLILKGNNKFFLKDFQEENLLNKDMPYTIKYNFELGTYLIKTKTEIFLNMCLDNPFNNLMIDKSRTIPLEFENLVLYDYEYTLDLKQLKVTYLPENLKFDSEFFKCDLEYINQGNTLKLNLKIENKKLIVNPKDFVQYNESLLKINQKLNESISLKL